MYGLNNAHVRQPLTLAELADHAGVEMRTLRSWIQQGLVPGPETVGRNARYAPAALTRARAVKAMKDVYGLPLAAIRQDLLAADEERIAAYAKLVEPAALAPAGERGQSPAPDGAAAPVGSTASEYLRGLRNAGVFGAQTTLPSAAAIRAAAARTRPSSREAQSNSATSPASSGSRLSRLTEGLERIAGARPPRRKAKGEVRLHIAITPDVELTVRGDHSSEEIARFEHVADLMRVILTGAAEHD